MTLYAPKHRTPRAAFRAPGAFASVHMRMYVYSTVKFTLKKSPVPDSDSLPV